MIRKTFPLAIFVALTAPGCVAPTSSSEETGSQSQAVVAPPGYDIGSLKENGYCLDVYAFNTLSALGTLTNWDCNGLQNQKWAYNFATHQIVSQWSWKCLTTWNHDWYGMGAISIGMNDCDPNDERQRFTLNWNGKIIYDTHPEWCMRRQWFTHAVTNPDGAGGYTHGYWTAVMLGKCDDADWQTWERWTWQLTVN